MKRNKHFRKDVVIARIIFAMICIVIGVLIGMGISALMKHEGGNKDTQAENTQTTNTQLETEHNTQQVEDTQNTEVDSETGESEMTETLVSYVVTTAEIRLREAPNTDCATLANLSVETKLLLLETLDGWYKVSYEGVEGYISAEYATIVTEEETTVVRSDYVIMLDPGHQQNGDSTTEPIGPDAAEMKARVTSGAVGSTTGVPEYELTLEIGLLLREELQNRGYTVLMTRETHDVNISNMERAQMANQAGADISVRIHANSYTDDSVYGAETLAPSTGNPYAEDIAKDSQKLSQAVIHAYCEATGMKNRGVKIDDTMTGINWCENPVTIIELGFLSNPTDDTNMQDDAYQQKMVTGIADGIDAYFGF